MCAGFGVVVRKTVLNMSHLWDPPDPDHERRYRAGRSNRSVGIVLLVVTALVAGGVVAYVLSQWQEARSGVAALPTAAPTTSTTSTTLDDHHDDAPADHDQHDHDGADHRRSPGGR